MAHHPLARSSPPSRSAPRVHPGLRERKIPPRPLTRQSLYGGGRALKWLLFFVQGGLLINQAGRASRCSIGCSMLVWCSTTQDPSAVASAGRLRTGRSADLFGDRHWLGLQVAG